MSDMIPRAGDVVRRIVRERYFSDAGFKAGVDSIFDLMRCYAQERRDAIQDDWERIDERFKVEAGALLIGFDAGRSMQIKILEKQCHDLTSLSMPPMVFQVTPAEMETLRLNFPTGSEG